MKGVVLHKELAPNLPLVYGNSNLLQQVFTNIIVNSMQSMPEGGDLWVKTRFSPSVGEFGGAAEIIISDTGAGIPEEHLHKVFEPFFTTKKTGEGTGLGLSVSYGIVKEHGGEIKITSKVGEGSTFTVILPIVKETVKV
jgi:signal transduction histidine kinase